MPASFFFYDLETSGIKPREARIMQFAGQRTDMDLKPIGEPLNVLIKLTPDVVPDPDAIMITGLTPQMTVADGVTEAEFLKLFYEQVVQPGTIFLGFNSVRFDDEFMRFLKYRNFYDAYEWQWLDDSSRWDLLDVVRMTRALKPEGIEWPTNGDGSATNRLELLTKLNGLDHDQAHDALSDVHATIAVAQLIKQKQPKLFDYLLNVRRKKDVQKEVTSGKIFTYTTGKYPKETLHTSATVMLTELPGEKDHGSYLMYDLRYDPTPFLNMSVEKLIDVWHYNPDPSKLRLPVKTLKSNRCPALIPGFSKDAPTQKRLDLSEDTVQRNLAILNKHKAEFVATLLKAIEAMNVSRDQKKQDEPADCDTQLYDALPPAADKPVIRAIRASDPEELLDYQTKLRDKRLQQLLPRYKARNYPGSLTADERQAWDEFCKQRLLDGGTESRMAKYFKRLQELAAQPGLSDNQRFNLEELQLYGESILPDQT